MGDRIDDHGMVHSCERPAVGVVLVAPWGEEIDLLRVGHDRYLAARLFAWEHFLRGHRYHVTPSAVACECGDSFAGPG